MTRKPWLIYHMLFRICNPKANGCGFVIRPHNEKNEDHRSSKGEFGIANPEQQSLPYALSDLQSESQRLRICNPHC